jgi:hypothetical protein
LLIFDLEFHTTTQTIQFTTEYDLENTIGPAFMEPDSLADRIVNSSVT